MYVSFPHYFGCAHHLGRHFNMKCIRLGVVQSASDYNLGATKELPELVGSQGILHAVWIMQVHF